MNEQLWVEFWMDMNACLPAEKDDYFIDLVQSSFGMCAHTGGAEAFVTEARVTEMENIVYEKVRQRTHGADDEGKTIRKTFRHFDINDNGVITFDEFQQVLEAYGCVFSVAEMRALFDKFDRDSSDYLDYEEFSNFIALKGSGNNPNVNPVFALEREKPDQVLGKIKEKLISRGAHGIRGLGISFRRMDDSGDNKLDRMEFMWGLKENGHDISPAEFERIFKYFDKNNSGKIDFDEFLRAIRGDLNPVRRELVHLAFQKLDKTGNGIVDLEDLRGAYNATKHPKYISGQMTEDDILAEFLQQWDTLKKDGKVTLEEFEDYYKDVSASIDRDDYFELMIRNAWHIPGGEGWTANTTIPRHLEIGPDGRQRVAQAKGHEDFNYTTVKNRKWGAEV